MAALALSVVVFSGPTIYAADEIKQKDGLYAVFNTTQGEIVVKLFYKKTPLTVMNFVGLAEGAKKSNKAIGVPFYDGIKFHRVIKNFMIQGGDPMGNGRGGPGYAFPDEFDPSLRHDKPGILSMANSGPNTNGSQFFITHKRTPHLNDKHSVFGQVVTGQNVVNKIKMGDVMNTVKILRIGKDVKAYKADQKSFDKLKADLIVKKEKMMKEKAEKDAAAIKKKWPDAIKTKSGLMYIVTKEGTGPKPKKGQVIRAHYTGTFVDGKKFDSSRDRGDPIEFPVGTGRVIKGWDEALLDMKVGEARTLIIPYNLAYGEQGRGTIPGKATLVFDVELLDIK